MKVESKMKRERRKRCPICGELVEQFGKGGSVMVPGKLPEGVEVIKSDYEKHYHKPCYDSLFTKKKGKKSKEE